MKNFAAETGGTIMMRWRFVLMLMVGIAISGFARNGMAGPVKPSIAQESLIGCYVRATDIGIGTLVLSLNPDFSYSAIVMGNGGDSGGDLGKALGHWRLSANVVMLTPERETLGLIGGLGRLSVRRVGGAYSLHLLETGKRGTLSSSPCWSPGSPLFENTATNSRFSGEMLAGKLRETRAAAEGGDAHAQNKLAEMYAFGRGGVVYDNVEAVKWYRKAAEQGLAEAAYMVGVMYREGNGVGEDDAQAVLWFRKAAEQGYASAQSDLGVMYRDGKGVAKDDAQALLWFHKAAEQGEVSGQNNLAAMYVCGCGVAQDDAKALEWFAKAGEQPSWGAENMDQSSWMVDKLKVRDRLRRWKKAAIRGDARAKSRLGELYGTSDRDGGGDGDGRQQDDTQAARWYRRAAVQGDPAGQDDLGVMYRDGRGVTRDDEQAVLWFRK